MANIPQLIRSVARQNNVQQYIVEKDYALSYLMTAIANTDGLKEHLVLKGGTALRKLYFPNYRFSEDLDYSTRVPGSILQIDERMPAVIQQMNDALNERGPFQISYEALTLRLPHPDEQKAYTVHVQFPGQRQSLCRLKIEITVDEPILIPVEERPVLHNFAEDFEATIPVYSLYEITMEKFRALLQSKARLAERGWGASRVCRDYYDLWNLLQVPGLISTDFLSLLSQKCSVRKVAFTTAHDFLAEELLATAHQEWPQQLLPFVPGAPPAEEVLSQVKDLILTICQENSRESGMARHKE
jgi:predicted nucleotidyltransferase component of viral defense system